MKTIDSKKTTTKLITFLRTTFERENFTRALVAVSGGVDSATSLALTVRALGAENVHPVLLPYGALNRKQTSDAYRFAKFLGIVSKDIYTINIQPLVDPIISTDPHMDTLRRGNVMARIRMIVLYDLAKKLTALVVGTENKSEYLLGYYTRFGDSASDIEPLIGLYKMQVYQLARHLHVPKSILTRQPTAGLWEGQTDESEFGFSYTTADRVLAAHFDDGLTKQQIIRKEFDGSLEGSIWFWLEKGNIKKRLPHVPKF